MKLSTSTGDFRWYTDSVAEQIRLFKGTNFRYLNLEQDDDAILQDDDRLWRQRAEQWGEAAAEAGVTFVVSHSPCVSAFSDMKQETYDRALRTFRRSLEVCHMLSISRTVIHANTSLYLSNMAFYEKNRAFYRDLFDLMEKYEITVMTENMDKCTYYPLSTGGEMREFIEYVDHPLLAACWDTAHAHNNLKAKREGQYKCITDLGDKLKGLHIADNFGDGPHQHTWPFAGTVNFDSVMQGLVDVKYDGYFNFEASYTLLHQNNLPFHREGWEHNGKPVLRLLNPSVELKKKAESLLYETGKYILETYGCFDE